MEMLILYLHVPVPQTECIVPNTMINYSSREKNVRGIMLPTWNSIVLARQQMDDEGNWEDNDGSGVHLRINKIRKVQSLRA